jgi:hypothetical protein
VVVVERGWHSDVCLRGEDAGPVLRRLANGYEAVRWLCLGFGDRSYVVRRDHSLATMAAALFPGQGVILMTALRATPAEGFGADHAVSLAISQSGLDTLRAALDDAVETSPDGTPVLLDHGPYEGSRYYSATATYSLAYTCNTWTADMLRRAGLPVGAAHCSSTTSWRRRARLPPPRRRRQPRRSPPGPEAAQQGCMQVPGVGRAAAELAGGLGSLLLTEIQPASNSDSSTAATRRVVSMAFSPVVVLQL